MLKKLFESAYFKAMLVFVAGGTALMLIHNLIKTADAGNFINKINKAMMPFYIGIVIAFLLCPIYNRLVGAFYNGIKKLTYSVSSSIEASEAVKKALKKGNRILNVARAISTFICMAILVVFIALIGYFILPELFNSVINVMYKIPQGMTSFQEWTHSHFEKYPWVIKQVDTIANTGASDIIAWIQTNILNVRDTNGLAAQISNGVFNAVKVMINFVVGILFAMYLLNFKDRLFAIGRKLVAATCSEKRARGIFEFGYIMNTTFIGYIVGRIIDGVIIGIITFIVMSIFGIPLPILCSVIVGATNVIPFFGPFIGAVPAALLITLESPVHALYFLIFDLIIQQIDGNIIGPKIVGTAIGMSSFWVLVAVLVGGGLFGFIGMALGAPIFAVIYIYVNKLVTKRLDKRDKALFSDDYYYLEPYGLDASECMEKKSDAEKHI